MNRHQLDESDESKRKYIFASSAGEIDSLHHKPTARNQAYNKIFDRIISGNRFRESKSRFTKELKLDFRKNLNYRDWEEKGLYHIELIASYEEVATISKVLLKEIWDKIEKICESYEKKFHVTSDIDKTHTNFLGQSFLNEIGSALWFRDIMMDISAKYSQWGKPRGEYGFYLRLLRKQDERIKKLKGDLVIGSKFKQMVMLPIHGIDRIGMAGFYILTWPIEFVDIFILLGMEKFKIPSIEPNKYHSVPTQDEFWD